MNEQRVLPLMLWLAAMGCSGADGSSPSPPSPTTDSDAANAPELEAARCELPNGGYPSECNACLAASCCEPVEDCKADPMCNAQLTCIIDCQHVSDPTCAERCVQGDVVHIGYLAYDDCSFAECLSTCWM